jgi:hypothetical protein
VIGKDGKLAGKCQEPKRITKWQKGAVFDSGIFVDHKNALL